MLKKTYHPNAYLTRKKNIRSGLAARTKVLLLLERKSANAKTVAEETGISYSMTLHHLRLLKAENTVTRSDNKPYLWRITGAGQKRLTNLK